MARKATARFWHWNIFIMLAMGSTFTNLVYYTVDGMVTSTLIEGLGLVLLIIFLMCNLMGVIEVPIWLSIVFINLHSFALCYVQGVGMSSYLYLFPFVMAMIFFLRIRKNNLQLLALIIVTTVNLMAIVLLLPYHAHYEHQTDSVGYHHFVFNIIINFLLVMVTLYFALRLLDSKEMINKSERKFINTILNTSLEAVFIVDPLVMQIRQYNDKAAALFELDAFKKDQQGDSVAELLGSSIVSRIAEMSEAPGNSINWQGDSSFSRRQSSPFHGFVSIVSFEYSGKRYIKISILDITSVKLAELEALEAKERAENAGAAKTRFMSNMSHELRTPLNAIIGTLHLLIYDHELLQHTDHFKVLKNSSEHMLQLVNEVLDFSKLNAGKLELINEPFDFTLTLKQVTASFTTATRQKNIQLFTDIDCMPPGRKVAGDEMRLRQVLLNLLSNAVKFTEAGTVTVQAKIQNTDANGALIYFAVADTGIGIAPEKLHLIFESFTQVDAETTRKYGGSGLGLSICKELIKKMGGRLQVTSRAGMGSCFYFTLHMPFQQEKNMAAPAEHVPGPGNLNGIKVLLVEDNAFNMKIARRFLDSWGADTDPAENGMVAWELFQQKAYDLLLIDLEMPRMDGRQLLTRIRNMNKSIPAIAFTATVYENMHDDLQRHGFSACLHKPFRPDELLRNILNQLGDKKVA